MWRPGSSPAAITLSPVKIGERPGIRRAGPDALAVVSYSGFAVAIFSHFWRDPSGRMIADNKQDQIFFEWVLTHAAHVVTRGDSPLFTAELNAPLGVNLMANTSVIALAMPLSPITLVFGAAVTFALISTLALAGTATAWYLFLSRRVVHSRGAAYLGALFCGFGPAMISQSTGHPNIAGQFLVPLIVLAVFRLAEPLPPAGRIRRGLTLGALVVVQCFLNEEVLFLTALTVLVFLLLYLPPPAYRATLRRALPALGIAAGFAVVLLAYPLLHQFTGPQSYRGLPDFVRGLSSDLASFKELSRRSIFGDTAENIARIDQMGGPSEENTFFGWGMLVLTLAAGVALWRHRVARALFIAAVIFGVLSLGSRIRYDGRLTEQVGPWKLLAGLPLFDSVVPTRLALVVTPLLGVLVALVADRFVAKSADPDRPDLGVSGRVVWSSRCSWRSFPLLPTPQPASPRDQLPDFFTSGQWRAHLPADATVVPVPGGWFEYLEAMEWATAADLDFSIVGGYFLGPDTNRPDRVARSGRYRRRPCNSLAGLAVPAPCRWSATSRRPRPGPTSRTGERPRSSSVTGMATATNCARPSTNSSAPASTSTTSGSGTSGRRPRAVLGSLFHVQPTARAPGAAAG